MASTDDAAALATASNAFGCELYALLRGTAGNFALSPASIAGALAMTAAGARGETAAQLDRVLHVPAGAGADRAAFATAWGAAQRALTRDPAITLQIANRLFGDAHYAFAPAYVELLRTAFDAPLEPADFVGGAEAARVHINAWVEDQTARRITNLLPPRSVSAATRLVLVNAIYFLAQWDSPFKPSATTPGAFTTAAGVATQVPMMRQAASFRIARANGVSAIELPYVGLRTAMLVLLPDRVDGIAALEASLTADSLAAWRARLAEDFVALTLPRFQIDPPTGFALAAPLATLGMPLAFDPARADFTGIADPPNAADRLCISEVVHKAFVKVDERGTEAAAATAVVMLAGAAPRKAAAFVVDHPFVLVIFDRLSGLVLFLGRVSELS